MDNKIFDNIAKGASLFLLGGVLGGTLTYNTIDLDYKYYDTTPTQNYQETSVTTSSESESITPDDVVKYTPSEALDTVVSIDVVLSTGGNGIFGSRTYSGSGSGVIYSEDANGIYIITNNHVIEGANEIYIRLDDNDEQAQAFLIGRDPSTDLAVIYVTKEELQSNNINNYLVSHIGDSDELSVFDQVYAIGNAAGEGKSGTTGSISALNKSVPVDEDTTINAIQIDAAINPGNSGGALVNENGELIGINFAKIVSTELEGMGYSIPINEAVVVVNEIIENGSTTNPVIVGVESKPFMGVQTISLTAEAAAEYGFKFNKDIVVVSSVIYGSPADDAGLKSGDVILEFNGVEVSNYEELIAEIYKFEIGDTAEITILRDMQKLTTEITLGNSALY